MKTLFFIAFLASMLEGKTITMLTECPVSSHTTLVTSTMECPDINASSIGQEPIKIDFFKSLKDHHGTFAYKILYDDGSPCKGCGVRVEGDGWWIKDLTNKNGEFSIDVLADKNFRFSAKDQEDNWYYFKNIMQGIPEGKESKGVVCTDKNSTLARCNDPVDRVPSLSVEAQDAAVGKITKITATYTGSSTVYIWRIKAPEGSSKRVLNSHGGKSVADFTPDIIGTYKITVNIDSKSKTISIEVKN